MQKLSSNIPALNQHGYSWIGRLSPSIGVFIPDYNKWVSNPFYCNSIIYIPPRFEKANYVEGRDKIVEWCIFLKSCWLWPWYIPNSYFKTNRIECKTICTGIWLNYFIIFRKVNTVIHCAATVDFVISGISIEVGWLLCVTQLDYFRYLLWSLWFR